MKSGEIVAGRFEVEARSAVGGMGAVYRALDRESGERVALKVVSEIEIPDLERFAREGRLLAGIDHPAVVRYVAHGVAPGIGPFLAMEWLEGEDLGALLARRTLDEDEVLALGRRIAGALAAVHARGVVHRDVKPANVFLPAGSVARSKLLDFGIARRTDPTMAMTVTGALIGTVAYMAPEQARGQREIDGRADLFSLGCLLFECLAGRTAFAGSNIMAVLAKILLDDPPRLSALRAGVAPELEELIATLLSKAPELRPASAAEVETALGRIHATSPNAAPDTDVDLRPSTALLAVSHREQRLVSVLVASAPITFDLGDASTVREGAGSPLESAVRAVVPREARVERLGQGAVIAFLAGSGTATDQAASGARSALALRGSMPEARVALAMGRAVVAGSLPVGELIDRAVSLLGGSGAAVYVAVDEVTAGLLDPRFVVDGGARAMTLVSERAIAHAPRTLLGKATPFVGRRKELTLLEATWDECVGDEVARSILVTGPAGCGKSRLLMELLARLRASDAPPEVWIARGDPLRAGSPFGLAGELVRGAAGVREGESPAAGRVKIRTRVGRALPSAEADQVAVFLGELTGVPFDDGSDGKLRAARRDPVLMGDHLRGAWRDLLSAAGEPPLLIVVEDLQWGDLPSVGLLEVALGVRDRPLLVLALARPEVHTIFPDLWARRAPQEVKLGELSRRAANELATAVLGDGFDAAAVARVVERAEGNAFYLEELLRMVAEKRAAELPETVLAMVQARLESLAPSARQVLRAASVLGERFPRGAVAALVGLRDVGGELAELVSRELLAPPVEGRFEGELDHVFRHALVRDAAYAMLPELDRIAGHRCAAEWLERAGEHDAVLLAEHFQRGECGERAAEWWVRAAEDAWRGEDLDAVRARAERSERCGATGELLGRARLVEAEVAYWLGHEARAIELASAATSLLERGSDPWLTAAAVLADAAARAGEIDALAQIAGELASVAERRVGDTTNDTNPVEAAVALLRTTIPLWYAGRHDEADRLRSLAESLAAGSGIVDPRVTGWLHRIRAARLIRERDVSAYALEFRAAANAFDDAGDVRQAARQRINAGSALSSLGAYAEACDELRAARRGMQRLGLPREDAVALMCLGECLLPLGATDEALAVTREALSFLSSTADVRMHAGARRCLADVLLRQGELEQAEVEARRAVELVAQHPLDRGAFLAALAETLLARGRSSDALAASQAGMAILDELGWLDAGEARLLVAHARALRETGDHDAARAMIARAIAWIDDRAATIGDADRRRLFVESVPEHRQARELDRAWGSPAPVRTSALD